MAKAPNLPSWNEACIRFLKSLELAERSPLTLEAYQGDLDAFARWFKDTFKDDPLLATVTSSDLIDWKRYQVEILRHKPKTVNRRLAAMGAFLRFTEAQGWSIETHLPKYIREHRRGPQWLTINEERALMRAVTTKGNKRNIAVVVTLLKSGLRISELVGLTWGDITMSARKGELLVRRGKGAKQRPVPLHAEARKALQAIKPPKAPRDEPVFHGQRGPLTAHGIQQLMEPLGRAISMDIHPHMLRHTCAKRLVDAGTPLHVVARILGHDNTKTTEIYVEPSQQDLQSFIDRLSGGDDGDG
jgi:integrase/recombinase XerC